MVAVVKAPSEQVGRQLAQTANSSEFRVGATYPFCPDCGGTGRPNGHAPGDQVDDDIAKNRRVVITVPGLRWAVALSNSNLKAI